MDKPLVSEEFFNEARKVNIPVVWIDHHDVQGKIPDFVDYYNVALNKTKINEPVTALSYQVTGNKRDLWLAVVGCISDKFIPDFYSEFRKKYPKLSLDSEDAFEILYASEIGKVVRMLGFGLKDSLTNVVNMQKFLMKAKSPQEVLEENNKNLSLHHKFNEVDKKYQRLLEKAKIEGMKSGGLLFFSYGGLLSASSDLSNELNYLFPDKFIVVAYLMNDVKANISIRGNNARDILSKAIKGLDNARGGGHEMAVGGQIQTKDLDLFKERVEKLVDGV